MRVLALGAHPDDLEILCGGTLARYVEEGHEVVMCHATKGDRGSFEHTSEEIARIRHGEAARAAEICGAEHISLGLSDGEVNAGDVEQRMLVIDLVRRTRPDVIITHSTGDYMVDHNEISKLAVDASFLSSLPLIETRHGNHAVVPAVFHMETITGLGFAPTEFVDVTGTIETKARMLEAHESQLRWLMDHDGVDIVANMRTATAYRGFQAGVQYAEAFAPCLAWLRTRTRRLLP
jgi:LmbE family N-acetylglucosaminyl deacetylase